MGLGARAASAFEEGAMETRVGADGKNCPFLRPDGTVPLYPFPVAVYCRLPGGRIRIPSRDELARFCTSGHYHDCLAYRRSDTGRPS
jgi:hypothetical protein